MRRTGRRFGDRPGNYTVRWYHRPKWLRRRYNAATPRWSIVIRCTRGDRHFPLHPKTTQLRLSLNKNRNWERLDQLKSTMDVQVEEDMDYTIRDKPQLQQVDNDDRLGCHGGGRPHQVLHGRQKAFNGSRAAADADCHLSLRRSTAIYPHGRTLNKHANLPCLCCIQDGGRTVAWRGQGKKAARKTKMNVRAHRNELRWYMQSIDD